MDLGEKVIIGQLIGYYSIPKAKKITIIRVMTMPIISTKLHVPGTPKSLVPRKPLIEKLSAGTQGKLILLSAPAGFGKTSLIAEWANDPENKDHVSWVHLDENDNELVRFLSYAIAALQFHQKDVGEAALSGLQSVPPLPIEAVLTSLINDIDSLQGEHVLVLDDYHLIDAVPIHEATIFLLEYLPAHMCLVIATRTDPPLSLHRLRARGQMTEIRAQDLRFSRAETRRFLEGMLGIDFAAGDIAALDGRIEGWAAGLQMVALSLQGKQDVHHFIESFSASHRYIMDYLTEEIFNQQPQHIQKFLLGTSILDRLSGPLCEAVLCEEPWVLEQQAETYTAQQMLERLDQANLFLLPMDDQRNWYRYHRLFAELLRQRLSQTWPEEIAGLQRRASGWFVNAGSYEEAFQYALAANDLQAAADIVEGQGLALLKKGTLGTIFGWFSRLPEQIVRARPQLNVIYAWALLLTGETADIEEYLTAAEGSKVIVEDVDEMHGEIAAIRAYAAARREDVNLTLEQAHKAQTLLPKDDHSVRSVVSFVLGGVYYLQGDFPNAIGAMEDASQDGEKSGNLNVAVSALNALAGMLISQGKLLEAEQIYARGLKLGTSQGGHPLPIAASIYAGLARLHLARKELGIAREYATTGFELSEIWRNADSQINCLLVLAQVAQLEGNQAEAKGALQQARHLAETHVLTPGTADAIKNVESALKAKKTNWIPPGALVETLSERELEVLRLVAEGRSNEEIAAELIIAVGTVKAHTSSIYRKLNVRNRAQAIVTARELGLL
jgi:LuxR family maltose regulon positive regulatory protein